MYRVELKEHCCIHKQNLFSMFLMYRVELKVKYFSDALENKFKLGFLMYRVELKDISSLARLFLRFLFLMYRVELKAYDIHMERHRSKCVPNVPCGVERVLRPKTFFLFCSVPNVPCGVESKVVLGLSFSWLIVPNVPCGVERSFSSGMA